MSHSLMSHSLDSVKQERQRFWQLSNHRSLASLLVSWMHACPNAQTVVQTPSNTAMASQQANFARRSNKRHNGASHSCHRSVA
jgi:hypothetical protein